MRAADQDVDAPDVHIEVGGSQAGNPIDYEERLAAGLFEQLGDGFHVVTYGGGGLGCLQEFGFVLGLECGADLGQGDSLSVGSRDHIRLAAEGLHEANPAFPELASCENQNLVTRRGQVGDRSLHRTGSGA